MLEFNLRTESKFYENLQTIRGTVVGRVGK